MTQSPNSLWNQLIDEETIMFPADLPKSPTPPKSPKPSKSSKKNRLRERFESTVATSGEPSNKKRKDEKPTDLFRPVQEYLGYDMHFLKKPLTYAFNESVMLQKTKYNYRIPVIGLRDIIELNKVLGNMTDNFRIKGTSQYINGKLIRFSNKALPDEVIEFNSALQWKLVIKIQGYKTGTNGRRSPIWTITDAYQSL